MPVATRPGQRCHVFGGSAPRTCLACLCSRPARRPPRFPASLTALLTEERFSPFLPRDRALTLSPTRWLGGGKHEAQQRRRGGRFLPLSLFSLFLLFFLFAFFLLFFPSRFPPFLSSLLFSLRGRQCFRASEAITIVISR